MEALKGVLTALILCDNATLELSLSSGKHWIRCEHSAKHKKNISGTPGVKMQKLYRDFYSSFLLVLAIKKTNFTLSFSVHYSFTLTGSYFISLLTFKKVL